MRGLVRVGAGAASLGGVLRIVSTFIPYQANLAWLEALYGVIDLCLMFGLIAVYLATAEATGAFGLAAFVVALAGVASIVGPDTAVLGVDFYRVGAVVFVTGLAGLSVMLVIGGVMRLCATLWIASFASALASAALPQALTAAGLALGLGYIVAGAGMWRARGVT